jgi:hypothetical protein
MTILHHKKREDSVEGFEDYELQLCKICNKHFWREIIVEHTYAVHGIVLNQKELDK